MNKHLLIILKPLIAITLFLVCNFSSHAQINPKLFIDFGKHNASNDYIVNAGVSTSYKFGKNKIGAGVLFDIKPNSEKFFKNTFAEISRDFKIKKYKLNANAFFMYNDFSNLVVEYDWGVFVGLNNEKFKFNLGLFSKIFSLTSYAITEYMISDNYCFAENFGLLYCISYQIKPDENIYNLSIAITNKDYFLLTRSTNPMLKIYTNYRFSEDLMWFAEAWLKTSGSFNLSINYFGFLARTGLIWQIGK
ncbi:MAG: hypothetical protein PHF99_02010 [Bacteroidales bacterium]|nr:hypothetical protein [Bacteroidales bacterium]